MYIIKWYKVYKNFFVTNWNLIGKTLSILGKGNILSLKLLTGRQKAKSRSNFKKEKTRQQKQIRQKKSFQAPSSEKKQKEEQRAKTKMDSNSRDFYTKRLDQANKNWWWKCERAGARLRSSAAEKISRRATNQAGTQPRNRGNTGKQTDPLHGLRGHQVRAEALLPQLSRAKPNQPPHLPRVRLGSQLGGRRHVRKEVQRSHEEARTEGRWNLFGRTMDWLGRGADKGVQHGRAADRAQAGANLPLEDGIRGRLRQLKREVKR